MNRAPNHASCNSTTALIHLTSVHDPLEPGREATPQERAPAAWALPSEHHDAAALPERDRKDAGTTRPVRGLQVERTEAGHETAPIR